MTSTPKFLRLLPLMAIESANAHLNQTLGSSFFHRAGKRTSMRVPVAFQFVVQVGMRVEMEDRQPGHALSEGAQDGQCDRVVAAKRNYPQAFVEQLSDAVFDRCEWFMKGEFKIARIAVCSFGTEVYPGFSPRIRGIGAEGNADNRRRTGSTPQP